ncbi:MAG: ABC transporter substrate-binding protein, partial [Candidatus Wallbacteria bacterium]|nr:ABC transporter substrate-binding protein [Candidatus Wallbacteria bacterium]
MLYDIPLPIGTVISGCRVLEKISEGGMGAVYKALDLSLGRMVAIKIIKPMAMSAGRERFLSESRERFLQEAKMLAQCRHPGIVQIFAWGEHEGLPYFVMEYLEGDSLENFLSKARDLAEREKHPELPAIKAGKSDPGLPYFLRDPLISPLKDPDYLDKVNALIAELAETLGVVHRLGIIHRDIKPANILVCHSGAVKLVDFGLAKSEESHNLTQTKQVVGTFNYMAPEQFMGRQGKITPQTDIYGLGVTYYELSTMRRPVEEENVGAIAHAVTQGNLPEPRSINPAIPAWVNRIIMKCLHKDAEARYSSAGMLSEAIRNKDILNDPVQCEKALENNPEPGQPSYPKPDKWKILRSCFITLMILWIVFFIARTFHAPVSKLSEITETVKNPADLSPAYGDCIVAALFSNPATLNPLVDSDPEAETVNSLVLNCLIKKDVNNEWTGDLAERWEQSDDGKILTFYLKQGVKWHDEVGFQAADVLFTYQKIQELSAECWFSNIFTHIETLEAIDPMTVRVTYDTPYAPALNQWLFYILPEHVLNGKSLDSDCWNRTSIGTGPFRFSEWIPDEQIILTANQDYFNGRPFLQRCIFRIIPDESMKFLALQRDEIDLAWLNSDQFIKHADEEGFKNHFNIYRSSNN